MKYHFNTKHKKQLADLQTPVSVYLKVRDLYPESVLLESSDFHTSENSFSFIGVSPIARFTVIGKDVILRTPDNKSTQLKLDYQTKLTDIFNDFVKSFVIDNNDNPSGINGFFGYSAYDVVRHFEQLPDMKERNGAHTVPDMLYIFYKYIIVINHHKDELCIVENLMENESSKIEEFSALLDNRNFPTYDFRTVDEEHSPICDETYRKMVDQAIQHCKRGDVFQLVLSRQFQQKFSGDDFKVYRTLRSVNPSPYLFYFDFGSFRIFGSSPETHVKVEKGRAYIDPIAGTFRRTGNDEQDKILAEQLLEDPKENAEHVMLVDLARNDLSRNSSDVRIEFYKQIQYYSHVIHLVSRVSGNVPADKNVIKLFADTFPAGTLSGAPKVKAMNLIDEIESHSRGIYGGCIGYIGLNGEINQAITIRTFLSKNQTLYYQAGAGIVSKSDREKELQEVNHKLGALKKAIDLAADIKI